MVVLIAARCATASTAIRQPREVPPRARSASGRAVRGPAAARHPDPHLGSAKSKNRKNMIRIAAAGIGVSRMGAGERRSVQESRQMPDKTQHPHVMDHTRLAEYSGREYSNGSNPMRNCVRRSGCAAHRPRSEPSPPRRPFHHARRRSLGAQPRRIPRYPPRVASAGWRG